MAAFPALLPMHFPHMPLSTASGSPAGLLQHAGASGLTQGAFNAPPSCFASLLRQQVEGGHPVPCPLPLHTLAGKSVTGAALMGGLAALSALAVSSGSVVIEGDGRAAEENKDPAVLAQAEPPPQADLSQAALQTACLTIVPVSAPPVLAPAGHPMENTDTAADQNTIEVLAAGLADVETAASVSAASAQLNGGMGPTGDSLAGSLTAAAGLPAAASASVGAGMPAGKEVQAPGIGQHAGKGEAVPAPPSARISNLEGPTAHSEGASPTIVQAGQTGQPPASPASPGSAGALTETPGEEAGIQQASASPVAEAALSQAVPGQVREDPPRLDERSAAVQGTPHPRSLDGEIGPSVNPQGSLADEKLTQPASLERAGAQVQIQGKEAASSNPTRPSTAPGLGDQLPAAVTDRSTQERTPSPTAVQQAGTAPSQPPQAVPDTTKIASTGLAGSVRGNHRPAHTGPGNPGPAKPGSAKSNPAGPAAEASTLGQAPPGEPVPEGMSAYSLSKSGEIREPARLAEARSTPDLSPTIEADAAEQVRQELMQMARSGPASVRLRLYPEELGRIDIRLSHTPAGLEVTLAADQAGTARALESQLGQLRQSLAEAGLALNSLDISQGGLSGQAHARWQPGDNLSPGAGPHSSFNRPPTQEVDIARTSRRIPSSDGLTHIDFFI